MAITATEKAGGNDLRCEIFELRHEYLGDQGAFAAGAKTRECHAKFTAQCRYTILKTTPKPAKNWPDYACTASATGTDVKDEKSNGAGSSSGGNNLPPPPPPPPPPPARYDGYLILDGAFITEARVIELEDVLCGNRSLGKHSLRGNAKIRINNVCVSDAGYMHVRYRNVTTNSDWTSSSLMKPGDPIKP